MRSQILRVTQHGHCLIVFMQMEDQKHCSKCVIGEKLPEKLPQLAL